MEIVILRERLGEGYVDPVARRGRPPRIPISHRGLIRHCTLFDLDILRYVTRIEHPVRRIMKNLPSTKGGSGGGGGEGELLGSGSTSGRVGSDQFREHQHGGGRRSRATIRHGGVDRVADTRWKVVLVLQLQLGIMMKVQRRRGAGSGCDAGGRQ